ncbi:MAG: alpha/beta fold hydrolase [Myxococcaceae bacterium]
MDGELAYQSWGPVQPDQMVLLLHDFTDSHRATGDGFCDGWGKQLVGPVLTPHSGWVVSMNLLGSPFGSTSSSMVPSGPDGRPGLELSVEDLARAAAAGARMLGAKRVRAVVGIGLGGLVALKMLSLFDGLCDGVVAIGAGLALPLGARELLGLTRQFVQAGSFRKARGDFLLWTHRREHLLKQCGGREGMEKWLHEQAGAFTQNYNPQAYVSLAQTYCNADLKGTFGKVSAKVLLVAGSHDELAPPARVRDAYHELESAGAQCRLRELVEERGHAYLLSESGRLVDLFGEFFGSL